VTDHPDLAALAREGLALAEKATPGPYITQGHGVRNMVNIHMQDGTLASVAVWRSGVPGGDGEAEATADFIVHACNHATTLARALLASLEREREAADKAMLRDVLDEAVADDGG